MDSPTLSSTSISPAPAATRLANYTSVHIDPSPVPVVVVKSAPWSTQHADSGFGNVDLWSVVVGAFVKPVGRPPQVRHYQVPVAVINGTLRAVSAPALVNGPALGFDPELAYPQQLGAGNDLYDTVAGFLSAWLTGGGDLQRYSASADIRPFTRPRSPRCRCPPSPPIPPSRWSPATGSPPGFW